MEGNFNLQVVIQLWQVVLSVLILSVSLISAGFGAATVFVRRKECTEHKLQTAQEFKKVEQSLENLYNLNRNILDQVAFVKGKLDINKS